MVIPTLIVIVDLLLDLCISFQVHNYFDLLIINYLVKLVEYFLFIAVLF